MDELQLRGQRTVLLHVLALHPSYRSVPELVQELTASSEELAGGDDVEQAIRDLTGAGLLHCPGGIVRPTRAAIHLDEMDFFQRSSSAEKS